jgi:hypothetical protein
MARLPRRGRCNLLDLRGVRVKRATENYIGAGPLEFSIID